MRFSSILMKVYTGTETSDLQMGANTVGDLVAS